MNNEKQRIQADLKLEELKDKAREWNILAEENLELRKEIERLQNIINKATEYLKDNACYNDMGNFNDDLDYDKCGDLLEILVEVSDKEWAI